MLLGSNYPNDIAYKLVHHQGLDSGCDPLKMSLIRWRRGECLEGHPVSGWTVLLQLLSGSASANSVPDGRISCCSSAMGASDWLSEGYSAGLAVLAQSSPRRAFMDRPRFPLFLRPYYARLNL